MKIKGDLYNTRKESTITGPVTVAIEMIIQCGYTNLNI